MAVGDGQRGFALAAAQDWIELHSGAFDWLSEQGHVGATKGFGMGAIQRQRAYHDALADLATPAMGHPPLVRIAAVDDDGAAAYARERSSLPARLRTRQRSMSRFGSWRWRMA